MSPVPHAALLIVNADDWGGYAAGTDAIEACFAAGAISSASAMTYMADARRAAEIARAGTRPIGLHLNLTQPFDAADVPAAVRERQRQLCAHFADLRRRRWTVTPDPRVRRLVADGIRDQLDEHRRRYDADPTHVDSHHHVHVCPDVFRSPALPRGWRVRQTRSPTPAALRDGGARSLGDLPRRLKHAALARRFTTTARFWRARELAPGEGAVPLATAIEHARREPVELMVHPSYEAELALLLGDAWRAALAPAPLGSYTSLAHS